MVKPSMQVSLGAKIWTLNWEKYEMEAIEYRDYSFVNIEIEC
jgi:hypothetical protein